MASASSEWPTIVLNAAPANAPMRLAITRVSEALMEGCRLGWVTMTAEIAAHTGPGKPKRSKTTMASTAEIAALEVKRNASECEVAV